MDANLPDCQWTTPLHNIAEVNPMWVRKGPKSAVMKRDPTHRPPLITMGLKCGAEINAIDEEHQSTPLGWAARQGQADVGRLLLTKGADPLACGATWARLIEWAQRRGHKATVRQLERA